MAVRSVCTTHARHAAPAGRAVRRPPPHPYAMPGTAAHPGCKPRFAARRPSRRLAFAGALLRLCVVAGSALLLLAALRFMAGDLAFLSLVPVGLPAPQVSGNGRTGLPLEVAPVLQNPELPNGCEAASLACLLQYQGFSVSASEIARDWLPCQPFTCSGADRCGADPEQAYAGDPFSEKNGWYCFQGPVAEAANAYLGAQGSPLRAASLSGAGTDKLLAELLAGRPVAVWFTQDYEAPRLNTRFFWLLPSGEAYQPYANLHCVVLTGMSDDVCTLADPLQGTVQVDRALFDEVYTAMGGRAVTLG